MKNRFFIACFILVTVVFKAAAQLNVRYLTVDNGLTNNTVNCMYKDKQGFMWFGTVDGLNRYDGYEFKVFRNKFNDSNSLSNDWINTISEDQNKNIWIGTSSGVSIYHRFPGKFSSLYYLPFQNKTRRKVGKVGIIKADNRNNLFIGAAYRGLLVCSGDANTANQIPFKTEAGLDTNYDVQVIHVDAQNRVWLFIENHGLCLYDNPSRQIRLINATLKSASCLEAEGENLWVGTPEGLYRYNIVSNSYEDVYKKKPGQLTENKIFDLSLDQNKVLWIATYGGGLNFLHTTTGKMDYLFQGLHSLNSSAVRIIYKDSEARMWLGTLRGGINIIDPVKNRFPTIAHDPANPNSLIYDFVSCFQEASDGRIWTGTEGGLSVWNRKTNQFTNYKHDAGNPSSLSNDVVTCIKEDYRNDIWIATYGGGINRHNLATNSFEHYSCKTPNGNEFKNVWLLFEDKDKDLWACTYINGLIFRFNRNTDRFEVFDQKFTNIISINEDKTGALWAGTDSLLIRLDKKYGRHAAYYINKPTRAILEDKAGNFWVGTEGGGLLLFDRQQNKIIARYTTQEGLCNNSVLNILEDQQGNLWLSTYSGLSQFNLASKTFKNYFKEDGLQSNQFLYNAALALRSGELAFGGIKGFNIFYPEKIVPVQNVSNLLLTDIKVNNIPLEQDNSYVVNKEGSIINALKVPYNKAALSFDFVALEYNAPHKISYAYYLEGWDRNWNYTGNLRSANYTRLKEGRYIFRVKCTNAEGAWNPKEVALKIRVLPPWYRTWWAYTFYALAVINLIYLYVLYNKRQERLRYEVKLALIDKEKEKELTEKKIDFFTHISHEFRTPLTLIINPLKELIAEGTSEPVHKKLTIVQRNAKRLLSLVNQLLLFRKADAVDQHLRMETFDLAESCNEVYLSFAQLAASKKINLVFKKPADPILVHGDKGKIEIVLFNLLSNAVKFTPSSGEISLSIIDRVHELNVEVKDSGEGIPEGVGNKIFDSFYRANNTKNASQTGFGIGLYVSQKLAKAHSGNLSYKSIAGEGTMFTLTLPKIDITADKSVITGTNNNRQTIMQELVEDFEEATASDNKDFIRDNESKVIDKITSGLPTMVIADDNTELRNYVKEIFQQKFNIYEADDGLPAFEIINKELPDIVISDVVMKKMSGIELCRTMKENDHLAHIPIILLTASISDQSKLQGIECGAEDYISKPFDKELIIARVESILKSRNRLQQYFFNIVTLKPASNVDGDNKEFLERCIQIVDANMDNPDFTIQKFSKLIGMSHPSLYKRIKSISGLTVNVFIRYLRLRKAAELLINTNKTIVEITYITGFNDMKYFREQFVRLFGMNPSEYVKRYRKSLGSKKEEENL